ncbi:Ig-like domain-containing protein [Phocaeicola plebeius]|uniref:Ig-like domain-containing protein n=1 Tax=Phocaeicola plebeius TaxID=310297 RepID=UPI0026E9B329|nr:Ig-like domain-containing protein [Phocaeicola plebeius]
MRKLVFTLVLILFSVDLLADTVRMQVGEKKTLTPYELSGKVLAGQPAWTSSRPSDVRIVSTTMTSCTIEAINAFSGYANVHCLYYYRELDPVTGQYIYQRSGYVDYDVFVEGIEPQSIEISPKEITLEYGEIKTMQVNIFPQKANQKITWSSTNSKIAYVNDLNVLGANGYGTAVVTATTVNGLSASCTVTVPDPNAGIQKVMLPESETLIVGQSITLTPTLFPSNASTNFTWSTENSLIATVSSSGKVTGINAGETVITVKTSNGKKASCYLTVKKRPSKPERISLPETLSIVEGYNYTLKPTIFPKDAEGSSRKWSSSNENIVFVNPLGILSARGVGTCTVTVTTYNNITATCKITVTKSKSEISPVIVKSKIAKINRLIKNTLNQKE